MSPKNKKPVLGILSFAILILSFIGFVFFFADDSPVQRATEEESNPAAAIEVLAEVVRALLLFLFGLGCALIVGTIALLRGERRALPLVSVTVSALILGTFVVLFLAYR